MFSNSRASHARARDYRPRSPETGVLYQVLQEHLEPFLAAANDADHEGGLPRFVQKELRGYLSCGILSRGLARFQCDSCRFERWVALSCKGRGFCPSCGGKRMTSMAAELTDGVIPYVPVRQFVLSVPHRLRYVLAYDHDRCTSVLRIFIRALLAFYRRRARKVGIPHGRTGTVTFIQRFGSAGNLNVHFHVVALDGVFTETRDGELRFHQAMPPSDQEIERLAETTRRRVLRHLDRGNHDIDGVGDDPVADANAPLASCYAGSVQGRQTLGRRKGAKLERLGADPHASWRDIKRSLHAHVDGFDLHASRVIRAERRDQRTRLEDLLRYCARPPFSDERLSLNAKSQVTLKLKTPWHDGTTHIVHDPLDFLAKLAALIPRPHKNLVIYHGVLAANAAWRDRVVSYGRPCTEPKHAESCTDAHPHRERIPRHMRRQWAEMMRRGFELDVLACPKCSGRLRLLAIIIDRSTLRKLLGHANLPTEPPPLTPWRASPEANATFDDVA